MLYQVVLIIHTLVAMTIIGLVFLQHGKGADIGAAFGSGASNTVFGSQGSGGVLYKLTGFLALVFCITSISLTMILAKDRRVALTVKALPSSSQTVPVQPEIKNENKNSDVPSTDSINKTSDK